MAIPVTNANFKTTLSAKISDAATAFTMDRSTDSDGVTLAGQFYVTFDEGTSIEEHMIVTMTGASGVIDVRGLSRVNGLSSLPANLFDHDRGAEIKMTDFGLLRVIRALNGTDALAALLKYASIGAPTLGQFNLPSWDYVKAYADALAVAGAPDASATVKGIVEEATLAEALAGTDVGATGARLFVSPSNLAKIIQGGSFLYAVEDGTGADDTYTAALTPALTAYTAGQVVIVKLTVANTGPSTLNLNALGAKAVKKYVSGAKADIETGDIVANYVGIFEYDGTDMVLVASLASMPTSAALSGLAALYAASGIVANVQEFTVSGTWTKPTGAKQVQVICVGSGGGGGGGMKGVGVLGGAGGGGGGGAVTIGTINASNCGATETVTVGVGGSGGAARAAGGGTLNGNDGTNGGESSFGTWFRAGGGGKGQGNNGSSTAGGGGGGGFSSAATSTAGTPAATGSASGLGNQGTNGQSAAIGPSAEYGGASGGGTNGTSGGSSGGGSIFAGGGGGSGASGGGGSSSPGSAGGAVGAYTAGTGAAGGTTAGTAGTAGSSNATAKNGYGGGGGGGGGCGTNGPAGAGGAGGAPGGGGGGGAGVRTDADGVASGAGGAGAAGLVRVITFF